MASAPTSGATASNSLSQAPGSRTTARQTRTNPSRVSKTAARSFPYYGSQHGQSSANDGAASQGTASNVPHGLFPALTHFTDAITALPREFRRHNSLLKEVDAKAWALEDNLHQLLLSASNSRPVPFPQNPAPIVDGEVREYAHNLNDPQNVESQESKQRRLLFDRIRRTLSDLMLTADEKNHVLTNANEELDHQLYRLDTVHPYIFNEVSEEARLGSLTHWAYSNRATAKAAAKTTTTERPRREAATATSHLVQALHEADVAAHRSEARRDATVRKPRRNQVDSDFDETRPTQRKGAAAKARAAGGDGADGTAPVPKRRRVVDKPAAVQTGSAAMERSTSTVTNNGRTASKDSAGTEVKKRARAPNAVTTAGRKRNNTVTSAVDSPSAPSPPVIGTFNPPRSAPSPGPRPQSSRAQQATTQATSRQRPPSASSRANNGSSTFPLSGDVPLGSNSNSATVDKSLDSKANVPTEDSAKEKTPQLIPGDTVKKDALETKTTPLLDKEDRPEVKPMEAVNAAVQMSPALSTIGVTKGRTSKTSTPVVSTFAESQTRARSSRNNNNTNSETAAPTTKRNTHKKSNSTVSAAYKAKIAQQEEEEESSREGDDEDDESEPRYCYCNQVSFGEMVACDNDACPTEWFHLSCVGLAKPPGRNVKWYCTECKESMKRGRVSAR